MGCTAALTLLRSAAEDGPILQRTARHIQDRGDAVAAIIVLTRAADLSPLDSDRARRLAEVAYVGTEATGALSSASALLGDTRRADPPFGTSLRRPRPYNSC
ncbi:hypothetical protein AB0N88_04900 [Streptomyces sp. NPDC093516]|uniref:hypothetical protein n=1 Tax=Streptomyces sp. NPDC093516 TaxID=3155304 RepID=UPI00342DD08D